MQFGFGRSDITPRVGVQLYGYGPFLNRHSTAVRTALYARAMAISDGQDTGVIASCELVGVSREIADRTRALAAERCGIAAEHICIHCIHTHCGPTSKEAIGQGDPDGPYIETLPVRIADACVAAVADLQPGRLAHAVVPCEGIGYNREHDVRPSLEEALDENWRPARTDIIDTEAHVLRVDGNDGMRGFASYFSCHPVVGPAVQRHISSDFVGVATAMLEAEHPGTRGLFFQGCEGNTNSCVVHHPEQESLLALDVIASRYARQVRPGIGGAESIACDTLAFAQAQCKLPFAPLSEAELREMLAKEEAILTAAGVTDSAPDVARATVWATGLRRELARISAGTPIDDTFELWAMRLGEIVLIGAPFEIMHIYKRRVQAAFDFPVLVMALCNGAEGYLPERESFTMEGNYGAMRTPYMLGKTPFSPDVEDVVVEGMIDLVGRVSRPA